MHVLFSLFSLRARSFSLINVGQLLKGLLCFHRINFINEFVHLNIQLKLKKLKPPTIAKIESTVK